MHIIGRDAPPKICIVNVWGPYIGVQWQKHMLLSFAIKTKRYYCTKALTL